MLAGMVQMMGIGVGAHEKDCELKCMMIPFAYRAATATNLSDEDRAAYFKAYKAYYYDGYDYTYLADSFAKSAFSEIYNKYSPSVGIWESLKHHIFETTSAILSPDVKLTSTDVYTSLLINALLDTACEATTLADQIDQIIHDTSDGIISLYSIEIVADDGTKKTVKELLIDENDDVFQKSFSEFILKCAENPDKAAETTQLIGKTGKWIISAIESSDFISKFLKTSLPFLGFAIDNVDHIDEALSWIDFFIKHYDNKNEAIALCKNYKMLMECVSDDVIPVLTSMRSECSKISDDYTYPLIGIIDDYIEIISSATDSDLLKHYKQAKETVLEKDILHIFAAALKGFLSDKSPKYKLAVLTYDFFDLVYNINDRVDSEHIILFTKEFNNIFLSSVLFLRNMLELQGKAKYLDSPDDIEYSKAYLAALRMHWNIMAYEIKLSRKYYKEWIGENELIANLGLDEGESLVELYKDKLPATVNQYQQLYDECVDITRQGSEVRYYVGENEFWRIENRKYGESVRILEEIPSKEGMVFRSWQYHDKEYAPGMELVSDIYGGIVPEPCFCSNGGLTFQIHWDKASIIFYDANGGTDEPEWQYNYPGDTILTSKKPSRAGYTFLGWATFATATEPEYQAGGTLPSSIDYTICLYAVWKENHINTITYRTSHGTAPSPQNFTAGASVTLPTLSSTGFDFLGWSKNADAENVDYEGGKSYTLPEGNITLYAVWKAKTFDIIFDANGGSFEGVEGTTITKQKAYLEPFYVNPGAAPIAPDEDHEFSGYWTLNADGTGSSYKDGKWCNDIGGREASTKRLYAKWTKKAVQKTEATFRYDYTNCTYDDIQVPFVNGKAVVKLAAPSAEKIAEIGKAFIQWRHYYPDGSGYENHQIGDEITITDDYTVYAEWAEPSEDTRLSVTLDKSSYSPGETAILRITAYNSDHFIVDVSENDNFKIKAANGNKSTSGVFIEETSDSDENELKCYRNGTAYEVTVYIPDNCDGDIYTAQITASNGTYGVAGAETSNAKDAIAIRVTVTDHNPRPHEYTLCYDLNGGYGSVPETQLFTENDHVILAYGDGFERAGFAFKGWSLDSDGEGKLYKAGRDYQFLSDTYLFAVWEEVETGSDGLDLVLAVERYSKLYQPGETATVFVNSNNSNHFFFDARQCDGFMITNAAGEETTCGTWIAKASPDYDPTKQGYDYNSDFPVNIYIPDNCADGLYTVYVTVSNGRLVNGEDSDGEKITRTATFYVKENLDADSVSLSKTELTLHVGERRRLAATIEPQFVFNHNERTVEWKNDNSKAVFIDGDENIIHVEGPSSGKTATITASIDGKSASCIVNVVKCSHSDRIVDKEYLASQATCTNQATYYYVCECGDIGNSTYSYGELAPHHFPAEWTTVQEPTENSAGLKQRVCTECGTTEQEPIPATGTHTAHTPTANWCSDEESHWKECSTEDCLMVLEKEAHTFSELSIETPATETNTGLGYRVCVICQYEKSEEIPQLTHEHFFNTNWSFDAKNHWYACSCGMKSDESAHIDADSDGKCDVCGYEVEPEQPHKHTFSTAWSYDEAYHWHKSTCGHDDIVADKAAHTASAWIVDREATYRNAGRMHKECVTCGYILETAVIPASDPSQAPWWGITNRPETARKYTLTATAGHGGSITNEGTYTILTGLDLTYTITPMRGYAIESVFVDGRDMGAITEYTFRNVKANHTISATFRKSFENPFIDIFESDRYYDAVAFVYENGLFKGVSAREFAPDTTMTRAMFVTVLGRLANVNADMYNTVSFDDVEAGSWYAPYIQWACDAGIVNGYGDGKFGVNDPVTVEQAAVLLARFAAYSGIQTVNYTALSGFTDAATVSDWAVAPMQFVVGNGIYTGTANALEPQSPAKRSLLAEMLYAYVMHFGE